MGQVVTLKKVFKETGVSQKTGKPWTRFDVVDTNDVRYKTFNFQLGQLAENAEGKTVGLEFHVEQQGNYSNNILDSIDLNASQNGHHPEEFGGPPAEQRATAQAILQTGVAIGAGQDKQTIINRSASLARAIETAAAGIVTVTDPKQLFQIADEYVKYIEQGSEAFGQF